MFRARPRITPARRLRREEGQAFVEFAIVLPVLLMLVLAIYQLGTVYDKWQNLDGAAREGARAAIVGDPSGAAARAQSAAVATAAISPPPTVTTSSASLAGSPAIEVTVCSPYSINILGLIVKSGDLCRDATMRVE